jgi:Arc/MetJ-type ribon-helix-helix transcriptional regulator
MEIHLPDHLQRFIDDEVNAGRYSSRDDVVRLAVEQFRQSQAITPATTPSEHDPILGSMREDAELLDEIVEEAMRNRERRPWGLSPGE